MSKPAPSERRSLTGSAHTGCQLTAVLQFAQLLCPTEQLGGVTRQLMFTDSNHALESIDERPERLEDAPIGSLMSTLDLTASPSRLRRSGRVGG